jgi:3-deoxy-manno-octulosonate cytidylyltransferase (CMP-KDO synthetase)
MKTLPPCYGVIPARYGSSRFPGKPLADILGRPMFWHVHRRASRCPELRQVVLATDDERIRKAAQDLDVPVLMTRPDHASGTDRVLEAARLLAVPEEAVVVNIQGDEPALDPAMLSQVLSPFKDPNVQAATLARDMDPAEAAGPDRVKVVLDRKGNALYFSRAAIPWGEGRHLLHIGLYAFRMKTLARFAALPPAPLETREKLEQLRLLENGIPLRVVRTDCVCHAVDRPEDLELVRNILMEQNQ